MTLFEVSRSQLFYISMWWRICYGIIRIGFGLILVGFINTPMADLVKKLMSHEVLEDPSDVVFQTIITFLTAHPFSITYFLAAYLLFWGVVDIVLSINLLRHKLWAFPAGLYLIGFFVVYELYRFFHTYSLVLLTFIVIDLIIFALIYQEYHRLKGVSVLEQRE